MIPRLSAVLSSPRHIITERDLTTACQTCHEERNIADCKTSANGELRTYRCRGCGEPLVLVGYPTDRPVTGSASTEWLSIRVSSDLFVQMSSSRLRIPASSRSSLFGEPFL